ncbi:MAG: calcium/sodium antiporter [Planctomycetota bacterium]
MPAFIEDLAQTALGPWLLLLVGSLLLWGGAESLVRGAAALARRLGLSPMIIGATVVAFGTSAPELVVSVQAQVDGKPGSALGNIVGSNITNLGLVLGLTALILPLPVRRSVVLRELPLVLLAEAGLWALAMVDGRLTRVEGALLLLAFFALFFWLIRDALRTRDSTLVARSFAEDEGAPDAEAGRPTPRRSVQLAMIVAGLAGLALGADVFTGGAEVVGLRAGLDEDQVGLLILAFGTSLPELITSVVAALRRHVEISLGNLLGSNLFNTLFVGGTMAVIGDVPVARDQLTYHMPVMFGITLLVMPLALAGRYRLGRRAGVALVVLDLAWVAGTVLLRGGGAG